MEKTAISGSHGWLASHLCNRLGQYEVLGRDGKIPFDTEIIFDFAAYGNLAGQLSKPTITYKANTQRVSNIIEEIIGTPKKLIYISTSSVSLPIQTYYSASKKATEEMIQIAVRESGIKAVIVRPYTVIGSGEHTEHLIPKLIDSCIWGNEMKFVENPVHDFIDVEDFIDALMIIKDKAKFNGEVYEIGSGVQTTNKKIKDIVSRVVGYEPNLIPVKSLRSYDTTNWKANTRKIKRLGWKPKRSIKESILNMIPDFLPM
jgi:UDP-glucose 4-epimerase